MEQIYKSKMQAIGYDQNVCDIFVNWEDVKDELLIPERKRGSGNGTIHVFLGAADEELRKEFPQYYASVHNEIDATNGAIEIKHYFLSSNIISMLGYVCKYNHEHHYDIVPQVEEILDFITQSRATDGMLSTKSLFKLSTGATKLRPYFKQFESNGVFAKIIRKILLPNSAYKISLYKNNNNEYAAFWLIGFDNVSDFEADSNIEYLVSSDNIESACHQIICYGAPGTGKSHKIKAQLEGVSKENIFRTTFHPDSDYSTFVGAYKPTMEKSIDKIYTKGELISKLTEMKEGGVTYSPQKFGAKYWRSLKQLNLSDKKDILQACGMSDNYTVEFDKGVAVGEEYLACSKGSRIIYSFVPQAFLNAYIQAYRKPEEKVYLIIEEINRGNCAQVFGDLFQLLDRDAYGKSEYSIKADADLRAFLEETLGEDNIGIKDGELCLPSNLYIYATMNTSDQSLFPIDSAFKRRWDWEYEPIKYKNTDWKIAIDNTEYSWVSFQRKVNDKILSATSSEDKLLGDYFVNPSDGVITDKVLLNKILFYLWNDVCKDGEGDIFKVGETEDVSFSELYGENGTKTLKKMMSYLGVTAPDGNKVTIENDEENTEP
ncbi:AAA family ATPase [Bacteroides acidifaciens]|uniref:AAA family ATPase n=1 Tax=Bacteroides acidifaciens TaxID=85831 RepID=UPI00214A76C2|nr:AAA family ATPase [Bacteroides acidifaciens]MCR2005625.1 AAA family ATPase [Bacteroides acidifaciens]